MGAIKGIFEAVTSGIKNAVEGVAKMVESGLKLDLKGVGDGLSQAVGLDGGQSSPASQASNTMIEGQLAKLEKMLPPEEFSRIKEAAYKNADASENAGFGMRA